MVLVGEIDGHVHFAKPENDADLKEGRDSSVWVNFDYRGKTLGELMKGRPECDEIAFVDIVRRLKATGFPALPHVVDILFHAATQRDFVSMIAVLTLDYPGSPTPTHAEMLRLVEAFPESIMGSVSVNPNSENAANTLETKLRQLNDLNTKINNGCRPVVKLDPLTQRFDPGNLRAKELGWMYAIMEEMGAVLVAHTGVFQTTQVDGDIVIADPARLTGVEEKHPNLRIVLAHMGTPDIAVVNWWAAQGVQVRHFEHALEMVGRYPNVYGDMGGLLWFGDKPEGAYGEGECKNYYFGDRAHYAFSRVNGILEMERNSMYLAGLRAFGLGRGQLTRKLVYGSDFPIDGVDELKKQERKLGFNPARNTVKVFARA